MSDLDRVSINERFDLLPGPLQDLGDLKARAHRFDAGFLGKVRAGVSFSRPHSIVRCVEISLEIVDGFDALIVWQVANGCQFFTEGLSEQFLIQFFRDEGLTGASVHNSISLRG